MYGDIKLPRTKKYRPAPKPKPIQHQVEPQPDVVIDEAELDMPELSQKRRLSPRKHLARFRNWWGGLSRKEKLAVSGVTLLVLGVIGIGWFAFLRPSSIPSAVHAKISKPKPKAPITVASPLSGVQVDPSLASRPVTGIMIENSDSARPQSGLQDAGVVYEAIAEAGITRFLALFQDTSPQYIGPVRSLRPYYISYAAPFQASIVHVGGSPDALSEVTSGDFRNLDQFYNGAYFTRITARDAPHNVYTSFAELDQLNKSKGYTSSSFTSWPRKADKKLAVPTAKTIDFSISSPDFYAHYDYDKATNTYNRSEGGAPHMELVSASDATGVQIHPKVVIALVVPQSQGALDASGAYYTDYADTGSGSAYIFQDGGVAQVTWTKADTNSQLLFTDSSGQPVKLDTGQTWISLVADTGKVTYTP